MAQPAWEKIHEHIDREEIISKLSIDIPPEEVNEWLKGKYALASEKKYVIGVPALKAFKANYLDFYKALKEDFGKTKTAMTVGSSIDDLDLAVKASPAYKDALAKALNQEIDLKKTISGLCIAIEARLGQIYDIIQEEAAYDPRNINFKLDRTLIQYVEVFSPLLEKANKIINEAPDQVVQHNITVQHIDQHIGVFYEAIRQTLAQMDMESSMVFMELFNEKLNALKDPSLSPANRSSDIKALNSVISAKLNDIPDNTVINAQG